MVVRQRKGRIAGFTLIELLVVIAIIAILAAILFPVFAQAREAARKTTCQSDLKQFSNAFAMYRSDYDGRFPMGGWHASPAGTPDALGRSRDWHIAIYPYVKNQAVYYCPSSTDIHQNPTDWNRTSADYLFNNFLGRSGSGLNESAVVAPADCIMVIEGHSDWGRGQCITPFSNGQLVSNDIWCTEYTTFGRNASLMSGSMWGGAAGQTKVWGLPRHNGGGNVAFCDGHVKFYNNWDAKSAQDTVNKFEGVLPWRKHGSPEQNDSSTWGAQF